MRTYKKIITEPKEIEVLANIKCDLCGKIASGGDWGSSCYDVNEVDVEMTIRHKEGYNCPSEGSGTETVVDICPECFTKILLPFLREKGANIEEHEWDW